MLRPEDCQCTKEKTNPHSLRHEETSLVQFLPGIARMILAAALEVNSYEELRRSAIASGVPGTLRFVLILSRFRYELLSQPQIPRRFYPLQFLSSRLSTARSICSCFLVKVTIRPSLKPLLGSRRYTRYNPSNSLSAS